MPTLKSVVDNISSTTLACGYLTVPHGDQELGKVDYALPGF
jgi:hypothetical protein